MSIEEIAKDYKKQNGNKYIKNNDLLFYIISRLDSLERESSVDREELTKVKTQLKIFWILLPISISLTFFIVNII